MALALGTSPVDFTLPGVDGNDHSLDQYADKSALVVVFTCNHCPYALAWEPRLLEIQADYAEKGVQLIAISANDAEKYPADSFPAMKDHAANNNWNFPYLYDESQETARAYGAERTPEVFVFDNERTLAYHGKVDDNYEEPIAVEETYLRDALDAILAGNAPAVTTTDPVGCTIKWK
ncbi:MAG: thioredoxin family protein [Chloroflexota bacterium]